MPDDQAPEQPKQGGANTAINQEKTGRACKRSYAPAELGENFTSDWARGGILAVRPDRRLLGPALSGLCLSGGEYAELGPAPVGGRDAGDAQPNAGPERFFDPATGEYVLALTESNEERQRAEAERDSAEARLAREAAARRAAEARVAELEALLSRRREDV